MRRFVSIILLALSFHAHAQGTFIVSFGTLPPASPEILSGFGSLNLQGSTLGFRLELTGPTLGGYRPRSATITLHAGDSTTLLTGLSGYGEPNYDLIVRLPGEPPLPVDYYWAHDYFTGSVPLSDATLASLMAGETFLKVDYGAFGSVTGPIIAVPEPAPLTLAVLGLALFLRGKLRSSPSCSSALRG